MPGKRSLVQGLQRAAAPLAPPAPAHGGRDSTRGGTAKGMPPDVAIVARETAASGASAAPLLATTGAAPLQAAAGAAPAASGAAPRSSASVVDTQSVGEDFARGLGDDELELTIAYLIERRDRDGLEPADREVAIANLDVLTAEAARRGRASPALDRDAVQALLRDATAGAQQLAAIVQQLAGHRDGLRNHPLTEQFLERTVERLTWAAVAATAGHGYVELAASTGGQAGMALLGMAAARAHAAQVSLAILRPWCAFLLLHDRVAMLPLLQLEYRYRVLDREQRGVDAVFARLARFDPDALAAASADAPARVAALAAAFDEVIAEVERAEVIQRRVMQLQMAAELLAFAGSLRGMFALRGPPSAMALPMPAIAGAGGGAAAMGQVVVSAEWIAAIKHLVEIGAITAAGAAEALRVRGVSSAMAQASDLPQSVKDLLGEGPTTDAMKVTNASGAGVARPPRHHVLPQEDRPFFEERGFTGDLDIDNFTVEMEVADHQAQHGGGNWQMGRAWRGEWNQLVRRELQAGEERLGRRLTVAEIMQEIERLMRRRGMPLRFVPYRGE